MRRANESYLIWAFVEHMSVYGPFSGCPASILHKSTVGHYRPVSYPDGPITVRCGFIKKKSLLDVVYLLML